MVHARNPLGEGKTDRDMWKTSDKAMKSIVARNKRELPKTLMAAAKKGGIRNTTDLRVSNIKTKGNKVHFKLLTKDDSGSGSNHIYDTNTKKVTRVNEAKEENGSYFITSDESNKWTKVTAKNLAAAKKLAVKKFGNDDLVSVAFQPINSDKNDKKTAGKMEVVAIKDGKKWINEGMMSDIDAERQTVGKGGKLTPAQKVKVAKNVLKSNGMDVTKDMIAAIVQVLSEGVPTLQYDVVQTGGSVGEKAVRNIKELKGSHPKHLSTVHNDIEAAKRSVKRMNKMLSPGEKKYYGIRYKLAVIENGKYTGR
jgi:hypothetical protein